MLGVYVVKCELLLEWGLKVFNIVSLVWEIFFFLNMEDSDVWGVMLFVLLLGLCVIFCCVCV